MASNDFEMDAHPAKRRKIRKGTRSCWECKRRKIRCSLGEEDTGSPPCLGCKHRGIRCAGQEQPEPDPAEKNVDDGRKWLVEKIATLVEQYTAKAPAVTDNSKPLSPAEGRQGEANANPALDVWTLSNKHRSTGPNLSELGQSGNGVQGEPRPALSDLSNTIPTDLHTPLGRASKASVSNQIHSSHDGLPTTYPEPLCHALPSPLDLSIIYERNDHITICVHQMLLVPYGGNGSQERRLTELAEILNNAADLVATAKSLFLLAISFQNYIVEADRKALPFSEAPQKIISRLADMASSLISDDDVVSTVDGLECLMLRAVFLANDGRLKPAITTLRRAIVLGQLLGAHHSHTRPIDRSSERLPFIWHRLNYFEMFLCLILGLPQGAPSAMAPLQNLDTTSLHPMEALTYRHCQIISQILKRNQSQETLADAELTKQIDSELQDAARSMPSGWWLQPSLADIEKAGGDRSLEISRQMNQFFHYYLVTVLHFPQIVPGIADARRLQSTCVCAGSAREVLTRFHTFRSIEKLGYPCGAADYFALASCTVLLLAHISSRYDSAGDSQLVHQRLSDRELVHQALEHFSYGVACRKKYEEQSNEVRELLRAEEIVDTESFTSKARQTSDSACGDGTKPLYLLYHHLFGTLSVMRSGQILHEAPQHQRLPQPTIRRPSDTVLNTTCRRNPIRSLAHEDYQNNSYRPMAYPFACLPVDAPLEQADTIDPAALHLPKHPVEDPNSFFYAYDF